ncbi:hypothetical protein [Sphingobium ummariense]
MAAFDVMIGAGAAAAAAGVLVLRLSWARARRSAGLNAVGWLLILAGISAGMVAAGAWGVAVVAIIAMGTAAVLLGHAALTSPPGRSRPSERRAHMLPGKGEPLHLGQRVLTFLLAVPGAMLSALLVALAARAGAGAADWHEANGNALALFLLPTLWGVFAFLLLMLRRRGQLLLLALPAAASAAILWLGPQA